MKKRIFLIFSLIVLLLLVSGSSVCAGFFDQNFKVGVTDFKMPDGYHEGTINEYGAVNITNGTNQVFILEQKGTDVGKYIKNYEKQIKDSKNQQLQISNFTYDGNVIFKATNPHNHYTVHYWFVKNNNTYDVYTWDGNEKMDSIVTKLIES